MKENRYAVKIDERVAELEDGTLLFSPTKKAAIDDLYKFLREWRGSRHNRKRTAKKVGWGSDSRFDLKDRGEFVGVLRIVEL